MTARVHGIRVGAPARSLLTAGVVGGGAALARRHWSRHLQESLQATPPAVTTDDAVRLHVELDGPPNAPLTVVFVHGFSATLREFDRQREGLRVRARLVLFDQRGHGRSGWGDHRRATLEQLGHDLGRVLDEHGGTGPLVLVGHSMGGMAVLALAGQRPEVLAERLAGVALLSTSAGRLLPTVVGRSAARTLRRSRTLQVWLRLLWLVAPLVDRAAPFRRGPGRRWLRRKLFGRDPVPRPLLDEMQEMWTRMSTSIGAAFYPALARHDRSDALPALRGIPALVLAGDADRTIPAEHSRRIARELGPDARLVVVPGAGHMVNLTHAASVTDALHGLLDRAARRRRAAVSG